MKRIILDVDRTIITKTSWYQTCKCPGLIIPNDKINVFENYNKRFYENGDSESRTLFRKLTFDLIQERVSEKALGYFKLAGIKNDFRSGMFINDRFFECVGEYTFCCLLSVDEFCIKVIDLICRYYDENVSFIFLTNGYVPYMRGLLSKFMFKFYPEIEWQVVGSNISFHNGKIELIDEFNQKKKYTYVKKLIENKEEVVFLAEDSMDYPDLFSLVFNNGGYSFKVEYDDNNKSNWEELYNKIKNRKNLYNYLKNKSEVRISTIAKQENFYYNHTNIIGILELSESEFESICRKVNNNKIEKYFKKVFYLKYNRYYSRGLYYYFWLPPYLTMNLDGKFESCVRSFNLNLETLAYVCSLNPNDDKYLNLAIYVSCDHLLSILYLLVSFGEINNIEMIQYAMKKMIQTLYALTNKNILPDLNDVVDILREIDAKSFVFTSQCKKFILELDNYKTIFSFVDNLIGQLQDRKIDLNAVLCFAYGGVALGYSFISIYELITGKKLHFYITNYSSKKNDSVFDFDEESNFHISENDSLLLLDNNVTTFKSLKVVKNFLKNDKKIKNVFAAVPEVDYKNIQKWLFNEQFYEPLVKEWYDVLDFSPIENYVRAYNTWGTSTKSFLLDRIFRKNMLLDSFKLVSKSKVFFKERKICRIQNIYDLQLAIMMGATMIGIHAVETNKERYYEKEGTLIKIDRRYPNLPIPDYEVDGINYMVKKLDKNIKPVLVIETELDECIINDIVRIYGLEIESSGIQLQFRVNRNYLQRIKKMNFNFVIIGVGLDQTDINSYLKNLDTFLDKNSDFILLDMSNHQPQFIVNNSIEHHSCESKLEKLNNVIHTLQSITAKVILADDVDPKDLIYYQLFLLSKRINIVGIDMQNNIEINKSEQRYTKMINKKTNECFAIKIRKSVEKVKRWMYYDKSKY